MNTNLTASKIIICGLYAKELSNPYCTCAIDERRRVLAFKKLSEVLQDRLLTFHNKFQFLITTIGGGKTFSILFLYQCPSDSHSQSSEKTPQTSETRILEIKVREVPRGT